MKVVGSSEQEAIWKYALEGNSHMMIDSVAGSGKTFTGVEFCKRNKTDKIAYVAFNKHIQLELAKQLNQRNVSTMTYHGLGMKALGSAMRGIVVDQDKLQNILDSVINVQPKSLGFLLKARVRKMVSLAKQYSVEDRVSLDIIADHHNVELLGIEEQVMDLVPLILRACREQTATIDFDDMVWLPKQLGITMPRYDIMLIDEAQDTNASQQWLALEAARRMFVIGDPNQAIYGFRGSDSESMARIRKELEASKRGVVDMQLTYTRRCPKSHVELAKQVVPHIKALKTAPEGKVTSLNCKDAVNAMKPGDMVLCRVNGDLTKVAYALIKKGRKAVVRGRDIGDGVTKLIERAEKECGRTDIASVLSAAHEITTREVLKYAALPNDKGAQRAGATIDKYDCLEALSEDTRTSFDVKQRVQTIFSDFNAEGKPNNAVVCSSVHRAKGLEAEHVFILKPELIPHPMAKQKWEQQQEANLAYVAVTRSVYNSNSEGELTWVGAQPTMFKSKPKQKELVYAEKV